MAVRGNMWLVLFEYLPGYWAHLTCSHLKGLPWWPMEARFITGWGKDRGTENPQEEMGLWETAKASAVLWLRPAGQPQFVYSWRLGCCRPPEGRPCERGPPGKLDFCQPWRPECSGGLPQRSPEKTPHFRDRWGQLVWDQPDRGTGQSSDPSKLWCAPPQASRGPPASFLPLFSLHTKLDLLFLLRSQGRHRMLNHLFFLTVWKHAWIQANHLMFGCLLLIFLSWDLK